MITRILNSRLPLMIHTPVKVFDLPYCKAIAETGALPVFDTEFLGNQDILQHVKTLSKETFAFGIRLAKTDQDLIDQLKQEHISNLDALLIPVEKDNEVPDLSGFGDTKIIAETRHINIQEQLTEMAPHALVLRGNEAPGKVSQYSSFILMQWYLKNSDLPVFIHGGVGQYTSAGLLGAGASGLVLDSQVLLCEESPVSDNFKKLLQSVDEGDSTEIQIPGHDIFRVFAKPGTKIVKDLKQEAALAGTGDNTTENARQITDKIQEQMTAADNKDANFVQSLFYLGQDAVFAKHFAEDSNKLKDMVENFFTAIGEHLNLVDKFDPIVPDSTLAKDHNTRLPLIQGPMANVSDTPEFAAKVLEQGALPFLAMGSLPKEIARDMVEKTGKSIDTFGAGLIGIGAFNPAIEEHLELITSQKVPYALFAGGVPSQILELEKAGTKAYLHTPSVSMMDNAIAGGCTRFIFEGGEAGGHIGTLSSLVLWEEAIASLMKRKDDKILASLSLIFAGGISTSFASCFISSMTAFLAAKGTKIGIQAGTAYLFSHELVETKAVKKQYQDVVLENQETIVIGKSLGLASRTAPTPFARATLELEQKMLQDKMPLEERKEAFEKNNVGALLIGAKGFLPDFDKPGKEEHYTLFEDADHREKGNFLVGDSLAFFDEALSIEEIHNLYMEQKPLLFQHLNQWEILTSPKNRINDEIAVVGMGCVLPDADSPQALWENILNKKYSISEMPAERLNKELYWSEDKSAEDKTYTVLAGHIKDFEFDADRFGYSKEKAEKLSRSQQMLLHAAYQAVENANMLNKDNTFACKDPGRTAVVIATCLSNELCNDIQFKFWYPEILSMLESTDEFKNLSKEEADKVTAALQKGIEGSHSGYDPIHGVLLNIEASRVAKHLGIRGVNYVVDAACASSMAAIDAAVGELLSGEYDEVIVGGVNTDLAPEAFIGFAKMGAISADGSFPFDQRASGFVLGEGSVVFVLKRMKDALRDKDNIVGVINGIGASSDGRGKAIAAPNPAGQQLSITRCFDNIREGITPEQIQFVEAHGTSTIIGDQAEINTLKALYGDSPTGVSSIKSQIGHLLGCAGAAGVLKTLLALQNKTLPPNGQFENLADAHDLSDTGVFIIKDKQVWESDTSRKAAISSYGFGGINYHMTVEEMTEKYSPLPRQIFSDMDYDFNDDRIVVAGMGVLLPGASNTDEFWEKLVSGQSQLTTIPQETFDNAAYARMDKKSHYYLPNLKAGIVTDKNFNYLQYRMPPKMTPSIDIAQIFGLEAAGQALKSSGLINEEKALARTGIILGTIPGDRQSKSIIRCRKDLLADFVRSCSELNSEKAGRLADGLLEVIRTRIPASNEDTMPGMLSNIIAGRISNYFNLTGANYVLDASCASAGIAIRNAARSLQQKELDFVLAGGVDCNLYPGVLMAFKNLGLLSENDCHFFDKRSQGYVMGEGAAIHVLTTYKKAKEADMTILGEINACGVHSSVPEHLLSPSESAFVTAMDKTYRSSGIRKQDIDHLDLFAFSNVVGDMVENQAVKASFSHAMNCGNIKPQFGYFKAANPAVAMAKLMLMASHGQILPNFHFDENYSTMKGHELLIPGREIQDRKPGQPMRFAANVNGIGGNHLHLLMGTLPAMLEKPNVPAALPAEADAPTAEPSALPQQAYSSDAEGKKLRMVALLSGQGAQYVGMLKELFESDAHIRSIMEQGEAIFQEQRGYSLLDLMFGNNADNTDKDKDLNSTNNTQPAVFLSSAAIYSRLAMEGFSPDYFIGHSVGEYTALFCSGILSFDHAMRLIIKRSELMYQSTLEEPGKIMVVFANEKNTGKHIQESGISDIYITNKNSEKQTAVSGKAQAIEDFCVYLKAQKVVFRKLNLTGAFHTPLLKGASEQLRTFLDTLDFAPTNYGRIISNTLAAPYPKTSGEVKDLLARQIVSPVEFIKSVEYVYASGKTHFVEIGPSKLLVNLLKDINIGEYGTAVSVDRKKGQIESFTECRDYLAEHNALFAAPAAKPEEKDETSPTPTKPEETLSLVDLSDEFEDFKRNNQKVIDKILFEEFQRRKKDAAIEALERFEFNTRPVVISGVSVGLPGKTRHVFAKDNFDAILNGKNFIESLDQDAQERFIDKNIIKLYKQPDGNARFVQITKTEDVIHLAGQLGYFNLNDEYGIKEKYDVAMALGIAAGIEALKDANIPLVMQYKSLKDGRTLVPDGFALPEEMQEDTGVIITSLWPNSETLMEELEKYFYERFFLKPYEEFEKIYYFLMEKVEDSDIKDKLTDWFFAAKSGKRKDFTNYSFDRDFLANACPLGSAHLAQIIKAKGPNTLVSSACASTTLAIGIAEDWIRVGRCKRVLVVGGENATSSRQSQWVGTGFLALGAATIKKRVSEAAKPFDEDRNGTILGSGAVGLVIEDARETARRGMNGQCEILGTHIANSAYHTYNIDVPHMSKEMTKFIDRVERQHGISKKDYADKLLFMSHETYTPARGGSADAEVQVLENTFARHLNNICISNTKGFTGHTLGAAIEDVVMVKALQQRKAPPIANLKKIPANFQNLNFSGQDKIAAEYGMHLSAGFGSHFAFIFVKRREENPVEGNQAYAKWVQEITDCENPELKIIDNTLCAVAQNQGKKTAPAASAGTQGASSELLTKVKNIIAEQTGYTTDLLANDLDLEADLGIDTVKQVEIFGRIAAEFGFDVPDDLKLRDLNTIEKLAQYVADKTGLSMEAPSVNAGGTPDNAIIQKVKGIIAEQTGYTTDLLADDLDLEADLGIDTVKQVEIFGRVAAEFGFDVPDDLKLRDLNTIEKLAKYVADKTGLSMAAPSVNAGGAPDNAIIQKVKGIIAEQTGYTMDLLADDLDLEADLGIDTVKQVEIFGRVAAEFGFDVPDDLKLRDLNTIEKLAQYVADKTGLSMEASSANAESPADNSIIQKVKGIIADQTGYTTDLLADDLDLEADLGIDTVKQVEIFGRVAAEFGFDVPDDLKLRDLNTIEKLAQYVTQNTASQSENTDESEPLAETDSPAEEKIPVAEEKPASDIKRLVPRVTEIAAPEDTKGDFSGQNFLVTLDEKGWGQKITKKIQGLGGKVTTLGEASQNPDIAVDMTDTDKVEKLAKDLPQNHPNLTGFIHLAPMDFEKADQSNLEKALKASVTSAFILIRELYDTLNTKNALIASLTLDSVVLPYMEMEKGNTMPIHPVFAGVSGLFKTVNKELEQTRVKVVDCSLGDSEFDTAQNEAIDQFIQELLGTDTRCEVGIKNGNRYGLFLEEKQAEQGESIVSEKDTILVTGGAGGITFEILKQIATSHKTDFIILGRSDIQGTDPALLDAGLGQAELMEKAKALLPHAKPLEIKNEVERLVRIRKAAENIEILKSMGVEVAYHCADVTDGDKVKKIIDSHDKIDGILHAAGVELSQFIPKKQTKDFQLVMDVKTKGLANLIESMKDRAYKYLFTFSSVTAYFGNQGQADYTAANDVLAKTVMEEQRNHPERHYKVYAWTAWEEAGMAARPTVQKVLQERGVKFLPLKQGVDFFMEELSDTRETQILFSGMDHDFDLDGMLNAPEKDMFPFLDEKIEETRTSGTWTRMLSMDRDIFLKDHTMGDVPLFLGSTGIETMAQAARQIAEASHQLTRVTDFHIPYGIKLLKQRPKEIIIQGEKLSEAIMECKISSVFKNPTGQTMGNPTLHYQGKFEFSPIPIAAPKMEAPILSPVSFEGSMEELIYHPQRLFMKGLFATIREITSFDGATLVVKVSDQSNAPFFKGVTNPEFQTWPILIDAMFQTGGLVEFLTTSQTVLPYKIARMEFYKAPEKQEVYYCVTKKIASNNDTNIYSLRLVDDAGNIYIGIEDFEMVKMNLNILEPEYQIADKVKWK